MHAYHDDLAWFIRNRWTAAGVMGGDNGHGAPSLPPPPYLEDLLSTCYQASLLREEERPVRVRLLLAEPERLPTVEVPPMGLHRQMLASPRPCNETELRKLSQVADFSRSLIGVALNAEDEWEIWGLVHSGSRWRQAYCGGRQVPPAFPPLPVIWVMGPGRLAALMGTETLATLNEGCIITPDLNVFESRWLGEFFAAIRGEILAQLAATGGNGHNWDAIFDPQLLRIIGRHLMMRIISAIRESRQGGILLFLPHERAREFTSPNPLIALKYQFQDDGAGQRLPRLVLQILKALIETYSREISQGKRLGWQEYIHSHSDNLSLLEEATFEAAHQLADFAGVDGAVVLTNRSRMLGFGGMIKGDFDAVKTVVRALDAEGEQRLEEPTETVGTRHRSVYYLCHQVPEALGLVISHDGYVRLIKSKDGRVTYWEQANPFPLKIS
ncbi:MAG: putative sensor domain DACNV-containing protein [Thermodesulfobacteriota bacterium]